MHKTLLLTAALFVGSVVVASALDVPTSAEGCHRMLEDVTETADATKLAEETLGKLDDLMTTAERQCEAGQFTEVMQTAEAIRSALTANN